MPYPDAILADKGNATDAWDDHPQHHNELAARLNAAEQPAINVEGYIPISATVLDAWRAAIAAAKVTGRRIVCKSGVTYSLDKAGATEAFVIEEGSPLIDIDLCGSTLELSENTPILTVGNKTGDHQTFGLGWIRNGKIDANGVEYGSKHVVAGNQPTNGLYGAGRLGPNNELGWPDVPQAGVQYRTNFDGWHFENLEVVGIPYDENGVNLRPAFGFNLRQAGPGEATQNYMANMSWDNVHVEGANHGWRLIGNYDNPVAPYNCNILIDTDTIWWRNCSLDTGHIPNDVDGYSPDCGIHVASLGRCKGDVKIDGFVCRGVADVAIEVDTGASAIRNATAIDCGTVAYLAWNFNEDGALYPGAQVDAWEDCHVRVIEGVPGTLPFKGWADINEVGAPPVRERVLSRCTYYSEQAVPPVSGQVVDYKYSVGRIKLDLTISFEHLDMAPAAPTFGNLVLVGPNSSSERATIEGEVRIRLAGQQTNANKATIRGVFLGAPAADLTCNLDIHWSHNITGLVDGSLEIARLGDASVAGVTTLRGAMNVWVHEATGDSNPTAGFLGVTLATTTHLALDKTLDIWIDAKRMAAGCTRVVVPGSGHQAGLRVRGEFNVNPSTAVGSFGTVTPPAANTAVTYDRYVPSLLVLYGGTVTAVEISDDGANYYPIAPATPCAVRMWSGRSWRWQGSVAPTNARYLTMTNRVTE